MAVQAQYPSNVLLLNRTVQEGNNQLGNDYSLQPHPGGGAEREKGRLFDQSNMLFNNGVTGTNNARKRGREATTTTTIINPLVSSSMQLSQPNSQLIDLTQLHTPQPNVVSTGLRLAFTDNHHHHQQQQQQSQQQQWQQHHQQQSLSSQSSVLSSPLSEILSAHINQHRDQIDHLLLAQGEQLRRAIAEKIQTQYRALLETAKESIARKLKERDAEVEKATLRHAELQSRAAQLSAESQVWQVRARAQEATAAQLQVQLQHAIMGGGCSRAQDREEGASVGEAEDAESGYVDPNRVVVSSGPSCKACGKRVASVVLLPCRHLCVCGECDAMVQACPLCLSFRSSSVEVFL